MINNNAMSFNDNDVEIVTGGIKFSFFDEDKQNDYLPVGPSVDLLDGDKPKRKKRESSTSVAKSNNQVITETLQSYSDTNEMLKQTVTQLDILAIEAKKDLDVIRAAKTLKGKYNYASLITGNLSQILSTKVAAIREINSSIRISNDLDYKKLKDIRATENQDDDKYIMDLYNAFIMNPNTQNTGTNILGPSTSQMTISGNGIVRSNEDVMDQGYNNYINNRTPEQNMVRFESNPNVKEVLLYDQLTGAKHFAVMDMTTNQVIDNVPTFDDAIFLPGTTVDVRNKIARNIDINKTFPLVILNEDKRFDEY